MKYLTYILTHTISCFNNYNAQVYYSETWALNANIYYIETSAHSTKVYYSETWAHNANSEI